MFSKKLLDGASDSCICVPMKKALVTGAAGFIGANVVRELLEEGVEVRALIKPEENTQNLEGLHVERVEGDVLEAASLKKAIQGCDTPSHLAAIYKLWLPDPQAIYEVNIRGGNYMLLTARDDQVRAPTDEGAAGI